MFQSTLPTRGATPGSYFTDAHMMGFNPRSPRGERPSRLAGVGKQAGFNPRSPRGERLEDKGCYYGLTDVSIHAPHAGSDRVRVVPSSGGGEVSIHAPHAGSDAGSREQVRSRQGVSIHAPHAGSDREGGQIPISSARFQSTLPTRGATRRLVSSRLRPAVSIHAPHAGSDLSPPRLRAPTGSFNPRSPRGERLYSLFISDYK